MTTYIVKNPKEFRENIRNQLKDVLFHHDTCDDTRDDTRNDTDEIKQVKIYTNIEIALFNYSLHKARQQKGVILKWSIPAFVQIYIDHYKTILYNLEKYKELRDKITTGEITPKDFVFMTHQEWCPDIWKTHIEEKKRKDELKLNKKIQASTDMFVCKKCHNNKCTYYEMQTRSADESATIFVSCLTCGKNWRE